MTQKQQIILKSTTKSNSFYKWRNLGQKSENTCLSSHFSLVVANGLTFRSPSFCMVTIPQEYASAADTVEASSLLQGSHGFGGFISFECWLQIKEKYEKCVFLSLSCLLCIIAQHCGLCLNDSCHDSHHRPEILKMSLGLWYIGFYLK